MQGILSISLAEHCNSLNISAQLVLMPLSWLTNLVHAMHSPILKRGERKEREIKKEREREREIERRKGERRRREREKERR